MHPGTEVVQDLLAVGGRFGNVLLDRAVQWLGKGGGFHVRTLGRTSYEPSATGRGGDHHDDLAAVHAARHQQEVRHEALVNDAVAALTDAREVLRLLPSVVTDVDTHTYRG
ncbi:hypothetical protein [Streptomyces sp. Ac-502]|uniref:hypothetical protein n=1 Tax=Streptomyces sp. Ac-502 TaxID=3342801 RepID=UPI0038626B49